MATMAGTVMAKYNRLLDNLTPEDVAKEPSRDFTRIRVFSIKNVIHSLVLLGRDCLDTELRKLFPERKKDPPTKSAFVQQRAKLSDKALPFVFEELNSMFPFRMTLNGIHILAADWTDQNIPPDEEDGPFFISYNSKKGGYYQNHITTVYDVLERRFVDAVIQPRGEAGEAEAVREMVCRNPIEGKCLYIMDRGFNCFNLMAAICEAGNYFLIRSKEVGNDSFLDCFDLPKAKEFDIRHTFYISRSKKSEFKEEAGFKLIVSKQRFDYLDPSVPESTYILSFRIVNVNFR